MAPIVVIAIGNPSRGDDALGPLLAQRLADWLPGAGAETEVEVIEDFQLQVEHAMDLQDRRLALFIDACTGTPAPYTFSALTANADFGHTTHAISPAAVLHVFSQTFEILPPPAFVLCVRGESFELGADLSDAAASNLDAAFAGLKRLLNDPRPETWQSAVGKS